jgi:ABC-type antimicrobial peptide transport system permease subunit
MGSEPVVVIDEVMSQHAFGRHGALGKRLWIPAIGEVTVVGVVDHVRHWGLAGDDQAAVRDQFYYPFAQVPDPLMRFFSSIMSLAVHTTGAPLPVLEGLRRKLRGTNGDQALYEVRTMEQLARGSLARQRFLLLLFGIFATLALLLSCIGIYGVLAYVTGRRVPEIGMRMALGARARDVVWMVLRQSLGMVAAGVALGVAGSIGAARLLERLVVGVRSAEPLTMAAMIALLLAAALVASFLPARRASRVDPLQALRQE